MSKLLSLLKATTSGGVQLFNYHGKTERSRRIVPFLLAVLIGTLMFASVSAMMIGLKEEGNETAVLSLYTLVTSFVILMEGIYKSGDLLFKSKDNDMLFSMPIKKSTIILARMIKFYVFEMLYCLVFLLPAMIAYAVNVEVGVAYYLVAITMLILVPVIPIAVSCVVGLITTAISARFRRKTFLQVALSFVVLFAVAALLLFIYTTPDSGGRSMIMISDKLTEFYYPASVLVKLTTNFSVEQYLLFVAINIIVVAVVTFVISKFYFKIITMLGEIKKAKNVANNYNFIRHSQTSAMVRKEINKYFNTPVLLMNTAIGLVLFIIAVIAMCFKFDDIVNSLISSTENFPLTIDEIRSFLPSITFSLVAFASLMTFITATIISLEGKAFNQLKSMPISGKKIIMTKVLSAMLLIVPVTMIGSIVMIIKFQFNIIDIILTLIAVIALPLVTELIGILIDLKYARFDAESDVIVVKQSAGVLVATFLGLGMVLLTISLTFATVFLAGQTAGLLMMDAIFVIVALFLYFVILARGEEKIMKLNS